MGLRRLITCAPRVGCSPTSGGGHELRNLGDVVADYIRHYREHAQRELEFFRNQPSLGRPVALAALAERPDGKRLSHQRRLPAATLRAAAGTLTSIAPRLRACRTFAALIGQVETATARLKGIGELTVYDTALRIGAKLGLEPEAVYLHAGTREGARALGLDGARATVSLAELPRGFRRLRPREIEDCLCIYKAELGALVGPVSAARSAAGAGT